MASSAENKLNIRTGFESLEVQSKQQGLGVSETKTDRVLIKQLSYLKKHKDEIQTFLRHVAHGIDGLEGSLETVQKAQANAKMALSLLDALDSSNPKSVDEALGLCLEAHLSCIEAESDAGKAKIVSPSFLKRVEKLDRLLRNRMMSVFTALNVMTNSLIIPVDKGCTDPTNSGTANRSYFVREKLGGTEQMIFKPRVGQKQTSSCIDKGGGFRRQVAAYLIDRKNGGAADVSLSILAEMDDDTGSLQTFRKNQGDLKELSDEQSKKISLLNFQQVALHRLRFYDLDAHLGNFLIKSSQGEIKVTPIDFDDSLPWIKDLYDAKHTNLKMGIRFYPHMDKSLEAEVKQQLLSVDLESDVKILQDLHFSEGEIKLFKLTTIMLQEMAKRDFTLGEMLDELDSESFRSQIFETSDEALQDVCKASVEEAFKSNEKIKAEVLEARLNRADGPKVPEKGRDSIQALLDNHRSHRAALVVMKDLLEKFPNAQETTEALEYLKGKSRSNTNIIYDVFREIVQHMKTLSLHDQAKDLEKWMDGEFI